MSVSFYMKGNCPRIKFAFWRLTFFAGGHWQANWLPAVNVSRERFFTNLHVKWLHAFVSVGWRPA